MTQRKIADINSGSVSAEIGASFKFIQKMIDGIDLIIRDYENELSKEQKERLEQLKNEIRLIREKYPSDYEVARKVNKELLSVENVEYSFVHKKFPPNPSKTYQELTLDMQRCFEIEDEIFREIVVGIWERETSKKADYAKAENFGIVVHSGYGEIRLPGANGYNPSGNTTYISCSYLTDKQMDMYNTKVGMEFVVDISSLIVASMIDCVTNQVSTQDIYAIKKVGDYFVRAGYSINNSPITRLITPKAVERYCCEQAEKYNGGLLRDTRDLSKIINEIVLDKQNARPKNIILQTSGCRFDFLEYEQAKAMERVYGVPIKIINRALYRKKMGLEPYEEEEKREFYDQLVTYSQPKEYMEFGSFADIPFFYNSKSIFKTKTPDEVIKFLNAYFAEVVEAGNFDDNVKANIRRTLDIMIGYAKQKQREMKEKKERNI